MEKVIDTKRGGELKQSKYLCGAFLCLFFCLYLLGCSSARSKYYNNITIPENTEEREEIKEVSVSQFILGPGDEVEIEVWRQDDFSKTVKVSSSGIISYPPVGEIKASGISLVQLRNILRQGLLKYLVDPKVGITVVSVRSQKVFVLGEVKSPGVFQMDVPMTALEAVLEAGGFTDDAEQRSVILIRGDLEKPILKSLNLRDIYTKGNLEKNIFLERGDILYVSRSYIANVDRFFEHMSNIIIPVVELERGIVLEPLVEDVLEGKEPPAQFVQ